MGRKERSTAYLDIGFGGGFRFSFAFGGRGGLVGDNVVLVVVVVLLHPTFSPFHQRLKSGRAYTHEGFIQTDGVVHLDVACGIRFAAVRVPLLERLFLLAGSRRFLDSSRGFRRSFGLGGGFGGGFRFRGGGSLLRERVRTLAAAAGRLRGCTHFFLCRLLIRVRARVVVVVGLSRENVEGSTHGQGGGEKRSRAERTKSSADS